jgi:hypothetical protein
MPDSKDEARTLTDADIAAIVERAEKVIVDRFYSDLGRGFWRIVWGSIITGLVALAAFGAGKGIK